MQQWSMSSVKAHSFFLLKVVCNLCYSSSSVGLYFVGKLVFTSCMNKSWLLSALLVIIIERKKHTNKASWGKNWWSPCTYNTQPDKAHVSQLVCMTWRQVLRKSSIKPWRWDPVRNIFRLVSLVSNCGCFQGI